MISKDTQDTSSPQSPTSKARGDWGERIAEEYLVSLGCGITERKWRGYGFEIDLIATKGKRIIFVEVKTRKEGIGDPIDAVNNKKRQNMIRAADLFLKSKKLQFDYQFDIIAITGTPHDYTLQHVADAFFPTPKSRALFKH